MRHLFGAALIVCTFWNLWTFTRNVAELPPRNSDDLVVQHDRYRGIRDALLRSGSAKGYVGFVTNRTLQSKPETSDDGKRWSQAQYVMVPWILISQERAVGHGASDANPSLLIGDFWDGQPDTIPPNLVPLYDSGKGVILFLKRPTP